MKEYISHRGDLYDHQLLYVIYLDECKGKKSKMLACWKALLNLTNCVLKLAIPLDFQLLSKLFQVPLLLLIYLLPLVLEFTEGLCVFFNKTEQPPWIWIVTEQVLLAQMCTPLRDS